jgi:hypothetical protein
MRGPDLVRCPDPAHRILRLYRWNKYGLNISRSLTVANRQTLIFVKTRKRKKQRQYDITCQICLILLGVRCHFPTDAREPHVNRTSLSPPTLNGSNRSPARLVRPRSIVRSMRVSVAAFRCLHPSNRRFGCYVVI